jgi:hypothetical protein
MGVFVFSNSSCLLRKYFKSFLSVCAIVLKLFNTFSFRQLSIMMQQFSEKEKGLQELEKQRHHLQTVLREKQRAHGEEVNGIMGLYSEIVGEVSVQSLACLLKA